MSNVTQLRPTNDIVATLRSWADDFETGREPMPASLLMVAVNTGDIPDIYSAGAPMGRYEEIGVFEVCKVLTADVVIVRDTP